MLWRMLPRVLVVEDNLDMREALQRFLGANNFEVQALDSAEDGIDAIDEHGFDIALIDLNLPGKNGFELIRYIRAQDEAMPLIAMTARDGLADKLAGFEIGLTDYIVKPFDLKELLARMQTHLRIAGVNNPAAEVTTQSYRLNPLTWEFYDHGELVSLTKTEFRMMHKLLMSARSVVKTNDLLEFVWGEDAAINPPVRIHLANLRRKIHDQHCEIIKTVPGVGYKLSDGPLI